MRGYEYELTVHWDMLLYEYHYDVQVVSHIVGARKTLNQSGWFLDLIYDVSLWGLAIRQYVREIQRDSFEKYQTTFRRRARYDLRDWTI